MTDYYWQHQTSAPIAAAIAAATAFASSTPKWAGAGDKGEIAHVRAMLIATMWCVDMLSTSPPTRVPAPSEGGSDVLELGPRILGDYPDKSRLNAAAAVLQTWRILAAKTTGSDAIPEPSIAHFKTIDGGPATPFSAGAAPILAGIVAVAGIAAAAATVCFVADRAADVIDHELAREAASRQMMATQANVLQVLADHVALEQAQGKTLPLTPAESAALNALGKAQGEANKTNKIPPKPKSGGLFESIGLVGLGALAVVAYVIFRK